jgi:hypothetical protein
MAFSSVIVAISFKTMCAEYMNVVAFFLKALSHFNIDAFIPCFAHYNVKNLIPVSVRSKPNISFLVFFYKR